MKIAAAHPTEVNGLVVLAGAVCDGAEREEFWRRLLMSVGFAVPAALQTCNKEIWWFKKDVKSIPHDLNTIKCPVIIFQSLADHMVPPENGFFAKEQLTASPSVKLVTFEGAHHDIPWTKFDDIKGALMGLK